MEGRRELCLCPGRSGDALLQSLLTGGVHISHAGAFPQKHNFHFDAHAAVCRNDAFKHGFHLFQAGAGIRTVFKEHGCFLRDGVHGGSAFDHADVVGGFAVTFGGRLHGVKRVDHGSKEMDCVAVAECAEGMAALGAHGDAIARTADCLVADASEPAVKRDDFPHAARVILHQPAAPLEVAEPFLTGICHEQKAAIRRLRLHAEVTRGKHQRCKVCRIIPNAGAEEPVAFPVQGHGGEVRKNGIRVRHKHHNLTAGCAVHGRDDVLRCINGHIRESIFFKPGFYKLRTLRFLMGRGGNPAKRFNQFDQRGFIFRRIAAGRGLQSAFHVLTLLFDCNEVQ